MPLKRILSGVLILLLCTGCNGNVSNVPPTPITEFSSNVEISCAEMVFGGNLTAEVSSLCLELTFPEPLAGMRVFCDGNGMTFSHHGLSFSAEDIAFPKENALLSLETILRQFRSANSTWYDNAVQIGESEWEFFLPECNGSILRTDFSGKIFAIESEEISLKAVFYPIE